jgi:hypothetical protein
VPQIRSPSQCPGHSPVGGLGRTFTDADHVGDLAHGLGLEPVGTTRTTHHPPGAQIGGQLVVQDTFGLHEPRPVETSHATPTAEGSSAWIRRSQPAICSGDHRCFSRSATTSANSGEVASLGTFGRVDAFHAAPSALTARYRAGPPLRLISRVIVEGERPSTVAIARHEAPAANPARSPPAPPTTTGSTSGSAGRDGSRRSCGSSSRSHPVAGPSTCRSRPATAPPHTAPTPACDPTVHGASPPLCSARIIHAIGRCCTDPLRPHRKDRNAECGKRVLLALSNRRGDGQFVARVGWRGHG